jgi:hypothetical protein
LEGLKGLGAPSDLRGDGVPEEMPPSAREALMEAEKARDRALDRVVLTHQRTVARSMEDYKVKMKKKLLELERRKRREQDLELLSRAVAQTINHRNYLESRRRSPLRPV